MQRGHIWKAAIRICVLGLLACAALEAPRAQTSVLAELKTQFNEDKGVPRLIVLVSPT